MLVDGRISFQPEAAIAAGFDYTGVGRCVPVAPHPAGPTTRDCGALPGRATPTGCPAPLHTGETTPVTLTRDPREGTPRARHVDLARLVFQLIAAGPEDADRVGDRAAYVDHAVLIPRRIGIDAPDFHRPARRQQREHRNQKVLHAGGMCASRERFRHDVSA